MPTPPTRTDATRPALGGLTLQTGPVDAGGRGACAQRELADHTCAVRLEAVAADVDAAPRGAVVRALPDGTLRRAEPGPAGPLVYEARPHGARTQVRVWGPASTPPEAVDRAVEAALAWCGARDDPHPLRGLADSDARLAALVHAAGAVRLSRTPRFEEAFGRAVVGQLVQRVEARRSMAQIAVTAGVPAPGRLWAWPTVAALGTTAAWHLRRCGVSHRGARALHAAVTDDRALLTARARGWGALDARLRALPGVGAWTSAETRLALGDPDAVSVGDYNLPSLICGVLGGIDPSEADDEAMLELLAPFAGQRGRVIALVKRAARLGAARRPPRRAARAPLSAHRYF